MTATPPPAPDSRPRCGGKPGQARTVQAPCPYNRPGCAVYHSKVCPGCADCDQPAASPSGGDARGKRHQRAVTASVANAYLDEMERLAAVLQEAREQIEAWKAAYDAAWQSSDARAEAAEQRLMAYDCREFDGFVNSDLLCCGDSDPHCLYHENETNKQRLREVEGALERWAAARKAWLESGANDYSRLEDVYASETDALYAAAATPSTDEEGRA